MKLSEKNSEKKSKGTVDRMSIAFSLDTADMINKMVQLPKYRNNRSFAVESLVTSSPEYIAFMEQEYKKGGTAEIGHPVRKDIKSKNKKSKQ